MSQCRFEKVFVIGCGKISATVLEYCASLQIGYGFKLLYMKNERAKNTATDGICEKYGIETLEIYEKNELTKFINGISVQSLIISAGNYYIFPQKIVKKDNLEIINFHYALLPRHRGRNAPSWAIYANENESGATWHYVDSSIDGGDIIWQGKCPILPEDKAWQLTKKIMDKAQEGIENFLSDLLVKRSQCVRQEKVCSEIHLSRDIPGEGFFDLKDNPLYIYALLRALDFGSVHPMGYVKTILKDGSVVQVKKYKRIEISSKKVKDENEGTFCIDLNDETMLLLKYEKIAKARVLGINCSSGDIAKLKNFYNEIDFNNYIADSPIDFESNDYERLKERIESEGILILATPKKDFNLINRLAWECQSVRKYVVIESMESFPIETENTRRMTKVWDMVAASCQG
ncbi:MAG: hypothetical protein NC489_34210 [Ruminococcus flavefaciens]|nr:hypothetical protein [Ruminococcus flavefaciens]